MTRELATTGQLRIGLLRLALVCMPAVVLLGGLSSRLAGPGESDPWFQLLVKPAAFPPGWLFGVVWTILYAMIGLALAIVLDARGARGRSLALGLFALQLALNLAWTPLFFGAHQIAPAFFLLLAVLGAATACCVAFARIRPLAGWLLIPYLMWLGFAAVLSFRFWQLNPEGAVVAAPVAELRLPATR